MKIEKEFLIFKRLLGQNCARPTAAWPQRRTWLGSAACVYAQCTLDATRSAASAWHGTARARLTGSYPMTKLHTVDDPSDGAPPGTVWIEAEAVDRPHRGPHGTQHAALALPVMTGD
jgi:hypothetical protein